MIIKTSKREAEKYSEKEQTKKQSTFIFFQKERTMSHSKYKAERPRKKDIKELWKIP